VAAGFQLSISGRFLVSTEVESKVSACLSEQPMHYASISEALDENPWNVLAVCRRLVTTGEFVELVYPNQGCFRKA
jgi:hypothetical protein